MHSLLLENTYTPVVIQAKQQSDKYLGCTSEDNAASLRLVAVHNKGKELVTNLLHLEQSSTCTNI